MSDEPIKPKRKPGRPKKEPGEPLSPRRVPSWQAVGQQYLPGERLARRAVDVDLEFKRALQMCSWFMDRMEDEINHSDGFTGVPQGFNAHMRDLASAMNTLSLSHARWLKANEEMYERLSDDERLNALLDWMVALHLRHPGIVRDWMTRLVSQLKIHSKAREVPTATPGDQPGPVAEYIGAEVGHDGTIGGPGRPNWKEIAAKVKADFAEKKRRAYARKEVAEALSKQIVGLEPLPKKDDDGN